MRHKSCGDMLFREQFLAASAPHSCRGLVAGAPPIASCGLRLDDEAIRVAVALRLGLDLGAPHTCRCEALVDARGPIVCKPAPSRTARHEQLNDLMTRALVSAGMPATRRDGKRPDGTTHIPWRSEKLSVWDVTVVSTLADSYVATAARGRGEVAELASARKFQKYADIPSAYIFLPIAMEILAARSMKCLVIDPRRVVHCPAAVDHNLALMRPCSSSHSPRHDDPDL